MTEAGFFAPQKVNRTGLVLVISMHAAAISALALSKIEMPEIVDYSPIELQSYEDPPVPPPNPTEPEADPAPTQKVRPTNPEPIVDPPIDRGTQIDAPRTDPVVQADPPYVPIREPGPIANPTPPVRIAALPDPRTAFQPPYPPQHERLGDEGVVKVRVLIGADGRVKAVEKVSATSDAFWKSTERYVLRNWRFRPATLDGRPVESWREMTVRFQLRADV